MDVTFPIGLGRPVSRMILNSYAGRRAAQAQARWFQFEGRPGPCQGASAARRHRGRSLSCSSGLHLRRRSWGLSDIGRRREGNEDAFLADDLLGLYVVCDGVGGQAKGEVASAESVEHVRNFIRTNYATVEDWLV